MSLSSFKSLAAILADAFTAADTAATDRHRLQAAWDRLVPAPLGKHCHPVLFSNGRLTVEVDAPPWASRLRAQQYAILERLQRDPLLAGLRELRIRVIPVATSRPAATITQPRGLSPEAAAVVDDTARAVSDPDLKAALKRLAAHSGRKR